VQALLTECLGARPSHDDLLVLFDESSERYIESLVAVAAELDIKVAFLFFPASYQAGLIAERDVIERDDLPHTVAAALQTPTMVLNILSGDTALAAVRRALLRLKRNPNARLAHVPGLTSDVLRALAAVNFDDVEQICESIAWALGNADGDYAIHTREPSGAEHHLVMPTRRWDRDPIMSTGRIAPGAWGNVPPGETYCCPQPGTAEGTIWIDGSIPERAFAAGEGVVLMFEQGRLHEWNYVGCDSQGFFEGVRQRAERSNDENWSVLCELGVGANRALDNMTGNSLVDEKIAGTVHIAIGDSSAFGYEISSGTHVDCVARRPHLVAGDLTVVANGIVDTSAINSRRESLAPTESYADEERVFMRPSRMEITSGLLRRKLTKGDRAGSVRIAADEMARALSELASAIPSEARSRSISEIVMATPEIDGHSTRTLLAYLNHYRMMGRDA